MKEKITVIGAGAWGTAIANLLAQNGHDVCATSDLSEISEEINQKNTHEIALPGINLEKSLRCSLDLKSEASNSSLIYIVVPSNVVPIIIEQLSEVTLQENCGFIICTKGLDHQSLKLFHQIIEEKIPNHPIAVLSGPNFAIEVAQKVPSVTNIASLDENFAKRVIKTMQNDYFKPIFLPNILIAEVSSIVKNIMAIACGINDGLGLGENSKAALVLQGIEEIKILAREIKRKEPSIVHCKTKYSKRFFRSFIFGMRKCTSWCLESHKNQKRINIEENFEFAVDNPASFGDIFLTCSTTKSRNNSLGSKIGQGEKYSDLKKTKTYEGAINAESINRLATKLGVNLPLCQTIHKILEGEFTVEEVESRLSQIICN